MKNILVIGGSSGIGKSFILQNKFDRIHSISRNPSKIERLNFVEYNLDLLKEPLPDLDILDEIVYCPGSINLKPFERLNPVDFQKDYDINVKGLIVVLQKYIELLKKSKSGSVVAFSTVASKTGMPFHSSVAAAKSALEGLMISLAAEYTPTIRFNTISLTLTDTPLAKGILRNEKMYDLMKQRHPLKQILNPDEVASFVHTILNTHSMTGQVLQMDCGITTIKT